jgi:hypothetical protein
MTNGELNATFEAASSEPPTHLYFLGHKYLRMDEVDALRAEIERLLDLIVDGDKRESALRAEIDRLKDIGDNFLLARNENTALRARIAELENVLGAITDEYEATLIDDYKSKYGNPIHPAMKSRLERDLSTVREARDILAKAEA